MKKAIKLNSPRRKTAGQSAAVPKPRTKEATRAAKPAEAEPGKAAAPPSPAADARRHGFPIAGIGASAGGLEALEELLTRMPNNIGMGFVIVTHQHPGHTSLLAELLGKTTTLPVIEARDGLKVEPDHVYVGPPGGYLAILNGVLHRVETDKPEAPRLPIDYFFRSLAQDQNDKAIGIILSGTGTDGTLGLKSIKGESGMVMVQQAQSAKYAGMPSSAIATGLADYVLPPAAMPKQLLAYAHGPYLAAPLADEAPTVPAEPMQKIFVLLRARTGQDFSGYKANTIRRRIERRMNLHQIKGPNQYVRFLQENPHELDILFKELLIGVTSFFRDAEAFEALAKSALPGLLKLRHEDHTLRLWVPGCSSGEEVFNLAILTRECLAALKKQAEVQIFGTDLDNEAIEAARIGQYSDGIVVDISPQRLERCFTRVDGAYRIRKDIREMTVFAIQNVIKDPPFTKLDLISCRNLLIYFNADLQKRLVPIFHYALRPGGLLLLGPSETIGGFTDLFDVVDKRWKIYRRKETALAIHPAMALPALPRLADPEATAPPASPLVQQTGNISVMDRMLLARFAPASVVVNDRAEVVYIHGRTGAYLEPAAGQPRLNLLDMAREGLRLDLAAALRQAAASNSEVIRENVRVRTNGDFAHISLSVTRILEPEAVRGLFLVTFRPHPAAAAAVRPRIRAPKAREHGRIRDLEHELQFTRESLQSTIEELQTTNEELKSSNEELQSTNEELQSTNEELETSKEEMQSLNEELTTVNAELQSKLADLSRTSDDMQNLLNGTEIATIFLDNELNIKRYTEQAKRLVNLIPTDVGRPLGDLASHLSYNLLVADCREVQRTLVFKQTEVQTSDGLWYLLRVMPYRTAENVIDGLVLTFVDINPVKEVQKSLHRLSQVFTDMVHPTFIVDLSGRVLDLNNEAMRLYGWPRDEMVGQPVKLIVPKAQQQLLDECLRRCSEGEAIRNVECVRVNKAGHEIPGRFTLSLLTDQRGTPEAISMITTHPQN